MHFRSTPFSRSLSFAAIAMIFCGAVPVVAAAGTISLDHSTMTVCVGGTGMFTATDSSSGSNTITPTGYSSAISVTPQSKKSPATFNVHGVSAGSTSINVSSTSGAPTVTETVKINALASPSPNSLSFNGTAATQTFNVLEQGPAGATVTATSNNTNVAMVSSAVTTTSANQTVTFTVTPVNGSSSGVSPQQATISIADSSGCSTGSVTATVTPGALTLSTTSLTFAGLGSPQTFTASETNYTGAIAVATPAPNPAVATISGSGNGPGPVTFTVTPVGFGSTTAAVKDDRGSKSVAILVSGGSLAISGTSTVSFAASDNASAHLAGSAVRVTGALQTTSTGNASIYVNSPGDITGTHGGVLKIARLTYNCTGNGSGNNQGATFASGFLQLIASTSATNCMTFPASQFSNLDFNLNLFLDDRSMPADTYTSTNGFQVVLSAT